MILTGVLIACGFFGVCWLIWDNLVLAVEIEGLRTDLYRKDLEIDRLTKQLDEKPKA
jgi:hypothetical protein